MEKTIKDWWNNGAAYYQSTFNIPVDDLYYGPFCPSEKEINLLDIKKIKNKRILELGCGGGQCSVFLSKNGAKCSGIDISVNQIQYAAKLAKKEKVNIAYRVGSGEDLGFFKDNEFNIVLAVFSMQYIKNLKKCLNEVRRVLKNGGKFIFSLDHPFYSVVSPKTMKVENNYNYDGPNETVKTSNIIKKEKWRNGNAQKFIFYFRKISDIYKGLVESGLRVEEIIEPVSHNGNDPWKKVYSKKLSKYIPSTIIFVAKK